MSEVVSKLTAGITSAHMFETLGDIMPIVIVLIPFSLGLFFLRKVIRGAGKGKATI